ncbi:DUF6531 domain-containing protein, partial [Candidatus Protochlamydia phocaeensis]|uniref:DUF6531 domain-containing protein n=1 Tax=Candidatus Protochlamydia phocaeensis TaxID=1414722 RepID=UPI001896842A
MKRIWIFLLACLSFFSLAAEEDNSEGDPFSSPQTQLHNALPLLVNDSVSVISGELLLSETDFVLSGPDSLVLTRHYSTGHLDKTMGYNWEFNRPGYMDIDRDADNYINGGRTRKVRFNQPSGLKTLHQSHKDAKENLLSFELVHSPGLTNCRSHEISARTNLHNIEVHLDSNTAHAIAMTGSGHLFYFQDRGKETEDRIFLHRRLKPLFERKPNGHFVIFHKNEVHALNPTQQLDYSHLIWDSHGPEELEIKASDGRSAIYKFVCYEHGQKEPEDPEERDRQLNLPIEPKKPKTKRYYLSEVNCSHKPKEIYEYSHLSFEEPTERPACLRLTCKRLPNDRFIKTKYDSQGRVKQQLAPVGTDQTPIVTHRFVYSSGAPKDSNRSDSPRSGKTEVFDALGRKTDYEYNTDQRLTQVTKYMGNKPYVSEHYIWDDEPDYLSSPFLQFIGFPIWDWLLSQSWIPIPDAALLDRGQTPPPPSFVELAQEAHQESSTSQDSVKVPLTRGHSRPPKVIEDMQQEQVNFPLQAKVDFLTLFEACLKGHRIQKSGKGNLMGKYVQDAAGHMESLLCFDYDDKGNVLAEFVYGNLTGQCQEKLESHSRWDVFNKRVECYAKRFAYTNDHLNLVIAELEDNGKGMLHGYVPGTNLVSAKYVMDNGRIILRQFYDYDENTTLVKLIKDDGSDFYRYDLKDVHERHVTYFYPRQTAPFGLPERIDEMYWDVNSNQEKLLKRVICHYSAQGKLIQQDHYDSNEMYRYSLFWEYDAHGNVIREVNALGQVITKQYDENDNLIFEQGPSLDFFTTYVYDYANRLIASKEDHGGKVLATSHRYDYVGNRVATIDPFGQETQYVYDDLNRLVKTIHPPVLNEAGHVIQPTVSTDYDFMGRPITVTDAKGNQTRTTYNARGKPVSILHADGTLEELIYALDGSLAASIAPNKTKTTYQRDCLGRVLKEEIWQGSTLLSSKSYAYQGLRLIKETDAEGIETSYEYDGAGRLIKETCGRFRKDMEYDSLNHLTKVTSWFGDDSSSVSIKCMSYDLLGRLLEEKTVDAFGQLLEQSAYIYDCLGNRTHAIQQTQTGLSINQVEYDSQSRPIKMIDAEGHVTHLFYDESFYNALGQQVLRIETTDPQGKITEKIFDALNRESVLSRKDSFGNLLAKQERYYDPCSNLCKTIDAVMVDGIQQSESINSWTYNEMGQETSCIEGLGTPEQKHTYTDYNAYGQKNRTT